MDFFNPSELRAKGSVLYRGGQVFNSADALLASEAKRAAVESYDLFLSHSRLDAQIIYGLTRTLEENNFSVYVYWLEGDSEGGAVTAETADRLRARMKTCRALLYATSQNADNSKWMPWELGYFDGFRGKVAICPITFDLKFEGREYLELYPIMEKDFWLWKNGRAYKKLRSWLDSD